MLITPEIARDMIEFNTSANRSVKGFKLAQYATDMADAAWQLTHQGIAFFESGELADGQHRLASIITTGTSVKMLVTFGLPEEARKAIDVGRVRSIAYALKTSNRAVAICRMVIGFPRYESVKLSPSQLSVALERNGKAINWVVNILPAKTYLTSAGVSAAFVRASYHENNSMLMEAASQIINGDSLPKGSPMLLLREWLVRPRLAGCGSSRQMMIYQKTQKALQLFCDGKKGKIHTTDKDLYPLPKNKSVDELTERYEEMLGATRKLITEIPELKPRAKPGQATR
jgi:hypothetical protein